MITETIERERTMINGKPGFLSHYRGLSTDTKPVDASNGDTFYEIDTVSLYMYDEASGDWVKQI